MQNKRQTSQYDKIFKENIEAVMSSILQNLLGITAISLEELPDDVQHTKERKPDVLKKITDNKGKIFVLQIEFQVADEPEMVYRMLEYKAMLLRKYKMDVEQFVIYLGKGPPKMETHLINIGLTFEYNLLVINSIDYKVFLNSNRPEEIILSVLANFDSETPESALKRIISRLEETTEGDLALRRYFKQLRILAQLSRLEQKLKNVVMDSIAKYIDEKKDVAFLVGLDKGQEKIIESLLTKLNYSLDQIADIAGVSVDFVKSVKARVKNNL